MAHCINKKSVDFQTLLRQTNLDESTLSAHVAVWQEDNGLDKWPTPSDLGYATKSIIKPGVSELFKSNPELANQVYEALGFKQTITQDNKSYYRGQIDTPIIDKDGNLILYGKEDELYKRAGLKSKGVSMTDDLQSAIEYGNGQLEVAQNLASESYDAEQELQKLSDNGYYLIQIPKDVSNKIVNEAGEVKVIGDKIVIPKGQYKIEQIVEGEEQQITPQQKQQALQRFQEYANTTGRTDIQGFKEFVGNKEETNLFESTTNRSKTLISRGHTFKSKNIQGTITRVQTMDGLKVNPLTGEIVKTFDEYKTDETTTVRRNTVHFSTNAMKESGGGDWTHADIGIIAQYSDIVNSNGDPISAEPSDTFFYSEDYFTIPKSSKIITTNKQAYTLFKNQGYNVDLIDKDLFSHIDSYETNSRLTNDKFANINNIVKNYNAINKDSVDRGVYDTSSKTHANTPLADFELKMAHSVDTTNSNQTKQFVKSFEALIDIIYALKEAKNINDITWKDINNYAEENENTQSFIPKWFFRDSLIPVIKGEFKKYLKVIPEIKTILEETKKDYPDIYNKIIKEVGEVKAVNDVIVPKGKYKIQHVTDMLQKSSTNSTSPSAELNSKLQQFLDKIGVKVETLGEGDFVARAKLVEKIIQVVQGKADVSTLPEESAHFFVDLLKANGSGLFTKMMADITNHPIYQQTLEEYKDTYLMSDGSVDINRIKEEAIGKLIAQNIVKIYQNGLKANEESNKSLLDRAWNMIKGVIGKVLNQLGITNFSNLIKQVDYYEQAAAKILNADVSDLKLDLDASKYEMLQKTNTTQKSIIDTIDKSQNRIVSDTKKVGVETRHIYKIDALTPKEKEIHGTPSTIASQSSRKKNKNRTVSEAQQKSWELAAKRGTIVHSWVEDITKNITSTSPLIDTSLYDSLSPANKKHYDTLKSKVTTLIDSIKEERPGSIFRTEVKVYDPNYLWTDDYGKQQRGIAGSIDLLVIHPDGTVSIYDWKTTSKKKGVEEISIWKAYEYNMQVALYKKMLMDGNSYMGVPKVNGIFKSRLIQINTEADVDGNLTKVQLVGDIPVAGEATGSKLLDSKLEVLYNRFYRLMNTKPPKDSVDREMFYNRIESLRDSIISLHLRRNYDKVAEDADDDLAYVEDLLSKEDLNLDDVKIGLEVTDLYHDILDYMEDTTDIEVSTKMALIAKRAKSLRNKLLDKQGELMQELASSFGVGDISETQRQVGFLEKTFRAASGINHPLVASLYEMSKRALYEAEQKNNALREDIIKHQEVLKKWASAKGLSLQQAYDLIVDKKTGNLISKYSKSFWEHRNKMDAAWMKENMEIDIERFNKQLAYQEERIKDKVFSRKPELDAKRKKEYIDDFKKTHSNVLTSAYVRVKPSKESMWKSKEMLNLEKPENKQLLDFYNFFSNTTKELSSWLPNFGWKPNFIPSIRTTWMENLSKLNSKTGANLYHALISRIGVNELNTKANVDELTGEYGGKVPVYFVNGLEADKKSYDLGRVLQLYGEMSYNFKQMSEIETAALAGMEILQGQEAYERSSFNPLGVKISPMTQNPSKTKEANQGWVDMYKTFTNYYVYGIRTENPTKFTQMLDSLGQFTSFNLLGLNPMPAIAATVANLANTQIQIGRNIYFDNKQYAKSLWMLSGGKMGNTEQKEIVYALLKLFEPHIDTRPQAKDRKLSTNIAVRNVTIDHFYAMLRNPDEINQNAVFLSMIQNSVYHNGKIILKSDYAKSLRPENYYHIPVKDRVPIDKAIAEKVKNTKSILDSCSIKDGKLHIEGMPEISTELLIAYRQMVRQVNKSIIGNMDPHDIATFKTNAYARSLMVFRNWMPRALEERYGELRYNRELGRYEWGRYNTFFKHVFTFQRDEANKLKWTAMLGVEEAAKLAYIKYINVRQDMADQLSEAEFIDLYKENMAAQYRGLAVTAGILLMLILGGRYMDDEDDLTPGEKYYAKIVRRAYSEMSMFINPVEALKILKSPTALTSPLSGIINVFTHSIKELGGAVFDVEDWQKNAHPLDKLLRFSPFTGVERTYRMFDEEYEDWLNEVNQDD